ncbi:methionyl-tRNA formyltransferase [Candidatus Margulisiibacteriota bacterium]
MARDRIVIATIMSWNIGLAEKIGEKIGRDVYLASEKSQLSVEYLKKINPRYIFFPHWSWIIPEKIYKNWECVVFHMTDLPFGRGGSPLQNLIKMDIPTTKISALKVIKEVDAGPIYFKKDLALHGSAEEIYKRASKIIFHEMIPFMIKNKPGPKPQSGEVVLFKRRTPAQSSVAGLGSLRELYDHIRMLDAECYPRAFLETDRFKFEFSNADLKGNSLMAEVKISSKEKQG